MKTVEVVDNLEKKIAPGETGDSFFRDPKTVKLLFLLSALPLFHHRVLYPCTQLGYSMIPFTSICFIYEALRITTRALLESHIAAPCMRSIGIALPSPTLKSRYFRLCPPTFVVIYSLQRRIFHSLDRVC